MAPKKNIVAEIGYLGGLLNDYKKDEWFAGDGLLAKRQAMDSINDLAKLGSMAMHLGSHRIIHMLLHHYHNKVLGEDGLLLSEPQLFTELKKGGRGTDFVRMVFNPTCKNTKYIPQELQDTFQDWERHIPILPDQSQFLNR